MRTRIQAAFLVLLATIAVAQAAEPVGGPDTIDPNPPLPRHAVHCLDDFWFRHDAMVRDMAFSPDGRTLAVWYEPGEILFWDVGTGAKRAGLAGHRGVARQSPAVFT